MIIIIKTCQFMWRDRYDVCKKIPIGVDGGGQVRLYFLALRLIHAGLLGPVRAYQLKTLHFVRTIRENWSLSLQMLKTGVLPPYLAATSPKTVQYCVMSHFSNLSGTITSHKVENTYRDQFSGHPEGQFEEALYRFCLKISIAACISAKTRFLKLLCTILLEMSTIQDRTCGTETSSGWVGINPKVYPCSQETIQDALKPRAKVHLLNKQSTAESNHGTDIFRFDYHLLLQNGTACKTI